jgi:hypothetical protein
VEKIFVGELNKLWDFNQKVIFPTLGFLVVDLLLLLLTFVLLSSQNTKGKKKYFSQLAF